MSSPVSTTSWHGPRETSLGNIRPSRASWGRSFNFFHSVLASASMKLSSSTAMSSRESTSRARHMRFMEPKAFIKTGISYPGTVLKQQRRPPQLADPVGDLGDLQIGAHRLFDMHQLPGLLQPGDEFLQIAITHVFIPSG